MEERRCVAYLAVGGVLDTDDEEMELVVRPHLTVLSHFDGWLGLAMCYGCYDATAVSFTMFSGAR